MKRIAALAGVLAVAVVSPASAAVPATPGPGHGLATAQTVTPAAAVLPAPDLPDTAAAQGVDPGMGVDTVAP